MPLLPPFGGLADEEPNNFIVTGEQGLRGVWIHETDVFAAVLEDFDDEVFAVTDDVMAELARLESPAVVERVLSSGQASRGDLVFQEHHSGTVRVEYGVSLLRGKVKSPAGSPCPDPSIESALRRWLARHETSIATAVRT